MNIKVNSLKNIVGGLAFGAALLHGLSETTQAQAGYNP